MLVGALNRLSMPAESMSDLIRVERVGPVLRIMLDRPQKANAMSAAMMHRLAKAVQGSSGENLIVLESTSPTSFCAGADISEFISGTRALQRQEKALLELIETMVLAEAPIIALAQGRASGAGAMLLAMADVVLSSSDVIIAVPEFAFGMFPVIVQVVLQSRLSPALTTRLCLGIDTIDAAEALKLGLVTEVLSAATFQRMKENRLDYYLTRQPGLRTLRASRRIDVATRIMREQLSTVAPMMMANFEAPSVRETIEAYMENLKHKTRHAGTHGV